MIYGLYLSATGIMTSTHQQDVIANNIANSETSGFKRSMSMVEQRKVESEARRIAGQDNRSVFDPIGGGHFLSPTMLDYSQGSLEQSSNPFDLAIQGTGFLSVRDGKGEQRLTRAGELMLNSEGNLVTAQGHQVLDIDKTPINLKGYAQHELTIGTKGEIRHGGDTLKTIGLLDVTDPTSLRPVGENMLANVGDAQLVPAKGQLLSGYTERSNVDPTTELTRLMEIQRLLEGNANMIKYQDATLAKAVNELGKIG